MQKEFKDLTGKTPMEGVNVTVPDESNFFRWEVSTSKKYLVVCITNKCQSMM